MHIVDLIVVCAAVVVLVACGLILARQRFMLRAPGTIPVALQPGPAARWQYGVARYSGGELRWYRSLGFGTRPNRVLRRSEGLPVFGSPTVAELDNPAYVPGIVGMKRVDDSGRPGGHR